MDNKKNKKAKKIKLTWQQQFGEKLTVNKYLALYLQLLLITIYQQPTLALFEGCDYTYNLNTTESILLSPSYPDLYPATTSCRYKFIAPVDNTITVKCFIALPKAPSSCTNDIFYVDTDGYSPLGQSDKYCGRGTLTRSTQYRTLTLAYTSGSGGAFNCTIVTTPQECDCGWSKTTRIVNGEDTAVNEYPSMVRIRIIGSSQPLFCGGTIITTRDVLTAAHCGDFEKDPEKLLIIVGDHILTKSNDSRYVARYRVKKFIPHPSYNAGSNVNDIALLRTRVHMIWSAGVGPICLPFRSGNPSLAYLTVTVLGWGTTSFGGPQSDTLQKAELSVVPNNICQNLFNDTNIRPSHICTTDNTGSSKDSCQNDSGGPVIITRSQQYLVGCISFGTGCGNKDSVGVNTRITSFLKWIRKNAAGRLCVKPLLL